MNVKSDSPAATSAYAGDITPKEAWDMLAREPRAQLIDVRTDAEWAYVGVVDLRTLGKEPLLVPWKFFPSQQVNPGFVAQVREKFPERDAPLLLICRSGIRSKDAAIALTREGYARCYNVAQGFEGDRDDKAHRNSRGGWRVDGLPWIQS